MNDEKPAEDPFSVENLVDVPPGPLPAEPRRKIRGWPKGKPRTFKLPDPDVEFYGMTGGEGWNSRCADRCNPQQGCVITRKGGSGICAHPDKGALQAADMLVGTVVERFNRARKYLAHKRVDRH